MLVPASLSRAAVLAALVAFSWLAAPALAYTVKSSVECPDVIREDSDDAYREMNKWWLMGYFTGRNFAINGEAGKAIEDENIYEMALDYCRSNPGDDWDDAAIHVYDRLD
jgi:hypothetical protein